MTTQEKQGKKSELQTVEQVRALSPFEEMDRLFDTLLSRGWFRPYAREWSGFGKAAMPFESRIPNVDVIDRDGEIIVRAELPGVEKKDLELSLTENTVTINGKTHHEEQEEKGDYYRCEMARGTYSRTLSLPSEIDEDKARASFRDGILEMTLPKQKKAKRRSITID